MRPLLAVVAATFLLALPAHAQEPTGVLREATGKLAVLGALNGREFFDAAIPLEKVEAVLVRTK